MSKQTSYFDVDGMYCSKCAMRIEKVVSKLDGVNDIQVNLAMERGKVTFNSKEISLPDIVQTINKIGFKARSIINQKDNDRSQNKAQEIRQLKYKFICSALLTIPLAWAMLAHFEWNTFIHVPSLFINPYFQLLITIPIQFVIGYQFYERAWQAIKSGSTNMDVLVVLSTTAAFFYSHYLTFTTKISSASEPIILYYETCAFIITFILLGKYLEAKTKWKTTESLEKLYGMQTKTATLYEDGREIAVHPNQLTKENIIIIKPGEKVPIDGQVMEGFSYIDESLLTGESIPIEKDIGQTVYAGTINTDGVLKVKVTKNDHETALSNIIKIVEEAQSSKAPVQHIADKITSYFIPVVLLIAFSTFIMWYYYLQPGVFNSALEKVITVLIIACPCALGLATPTSIMVGSGRAAELGILFKEGKYIELLSKGKHILLDKTGTITTGLPEVTDLFTFHLPEKELLRMVGAVERSSDHPVAKAILQKVSTSIDTLPTARQVQNMPGYGIQAMVNNYHVSIASPSYFLKHNYLINERESELIQKLESEGKTVMVVFIDNKLTSIIGVFDQIKPSSAVAIHALQKRGMNVKLLTGDHQYAGKAVAKKVGINAVYASLSPEDKSAIIKDLQHKDGQVVMVGDGINDAPALAVADIGIAIGTGSDIAIESGDVTIIKGDLQRLVDAMMISKKTMTNIKQNFLWAFLYNIMMIPFAMSGLLVPWLAGAAMAFSSVSVVLNALRLKNVKIS